MNYSELKALFCTHESNDPVNHLTAYITFSSFGPNCKKKYSWNSRTYVISSDNKAFQPNMGGYSIFGSCLDGADQHVRLENYMKEERSGLDGWIVEECCIVGYMLTERGDYGMVTPKIVYALEMAQQEMLSRLAGAIRADPMALIKQYSTNGYEVTEDYFYAKKYNAHISTAKCSESWEIKPVYIRGLLDITIGHER